MSEKKAFNFYKSFYDVALLIPDEDKVELLMCICETEFTGNIIEPKRELARLAFTSQLHSIKKQLEGYKSATKEGPSKGATKGPIKGPLVQEQEKEQEQEKDKDKLLNIEERKLSFANSLKPFVEKYGREFIKDFFYYWTESTIDKKKLKFETQKTFSIEHRLRTWNKNSVKFGSEYSKDNKPKFNPYG